MKLSSDDAKRMLLDGQCLTHKHSDPIEVISQLVAVQTQYAQSLPSALASRLKSGGLDWIEEEIAPNGRLIKSWSVRHTLHTMELPTFELLRLALERESYAAFLKWCHRAHGDDRATVERRNRRIMDALADGPLTRAQLHARIPEFKEMAWTGWGADVKGLAILGYLAMCSHRGETKFFLRQPLDLGLTERQARAEVLRRYMRAYGPASKADFHYWYGGYAGPVNQTWEDVFEELVPVEVDGRKGLYVHRDAPSAQELADVPSVRLLAKFDTLLLGHKDKSLYVHPKMQSLVFRKAGQVEAAVMVRGVIAGTWRAKNGSKGVEFAIERWPGKWSGSTLCALEREAARQAKAYGHRDFTIQFVDSLT